MIITSIKILIVAIVLFLATISCKKSNDADASIVGTWNFSEIGIDNNTNHIIDAGEMSTTAQMGAYGYWTIKSDNTYHSSIFDGANPYEESGTYTYANNIITTTTVGGTYNNNRVHSLTNNKIVIEHTSSHPSNWMILTK